MKPLTLEETRLKEEMKERCLNKGQYVDENAKAKFYVLCHLEDFEVQYWELQQENKQLKAQIEEYQKALDETLSEKIDIENNCNKLKQKIIDSFNKTQDVWFIDILQEIEKIEQGSDE